MLSVPENTTGAIGEPVSATDPDGDPLTYELSGADAASFAVDARTAQLSVAPVTLLDFETRSDFRFELVAADPQGLLARRTVVVTVEDVNEEPSFAAAGNLALSVPENTSGAIGEPGLRLIQTATP